MRREHGRKSSRGFWGRFLGILCFITFFCPPPDAQAFTLGETYDSSNWQEIEDVAVPELLNWVKKGEFVLKTSKLDFDFNEDAAYLEASQKNAGKFDVDEDGYIVDKATGKMLEFAYGDPFPNIDPKDPKAAEKIMHNAKYAFYRRGSFENSGRTFWIGESGAHREVMACGKFFNFTGHRRGPVDNPQKLLALSMAYVAEPFDLRGTVSMGWEYMEAGKYAQFAYVPMLRRVRRVSTATRSDPFLGSDFSTDDAGLWGGKNEDVTWKLLGETVTLVPITSPDKFLFKENPDGSLTRQVVPFTMGFQDPGWQGAPWAPTDIIWNPRPVWIVEGISKDLFYNYGRMVFYVDKDCDYIWLKDVYDKSDEYWKLMFAAKSLHLAPTMRILTNGLEDAYITLDRNTRHATAYVTVNYLPGRSDTILLPLTKLGPKDFSTSAILQLSK